MEEAKRPYATSRFRVLIALAEPKREAWVLCGFKPETDDEHSRVESLRSELGYDTRTGSHDLTATKDGALRDAKRVLRALTNGDRDRERRCLYETPLTTLEARGQHSGLTAYLTEVRALASTVTDPRRDEPAH